MLETGKVWSQDRLDEQLTAYFNTYHFGVVPSTRNQLVMKLMKDMNQFPSMYHMGALFLKSQASCTATEDKHEAIAALSRATEQAYAAAEVFVHYRHSENGISEITDESLSKILRGSLVTPHHAQFLWDPRTGTLV